MAAKKLSDEKIIEALMTSKTITAAAEKCGCARSTIHARLNDVVFRITLDEAIEARRNAVNALSAHALEVATETVLELLTEPGVSDDVKIRAASAVFRAFI